MFLGLVRKLRHLLVVLGGFRANFLSFLDEPFEILVLVEFSLALFVLLALGLDLLDEFLLFLTRENFGLLFELELLDFFLEFVEVLALVEFHVGFELFDFVEELVGLGVEFVTALFVLLNLLVELVALLTVFLSFVDLLARFGVQVVAAGGALGGHLVEIISPISQLACHFDKLAFRFVC